MPGVVDPWGSRRRLRARRNRAAIHLRGHAAALQPQGTAPIVRLGFLGTASGGAYYDQAFVQKCVDELEKRCAVAAAGIEELTPLERLAAELLISSAGLQR
ncbi:hypothetical protein [Methylibium petroleiphilum]|uniref:Uncharacterized protein n=1 Tax=Methylibium petroleiphilum (strain ATCC BAA-1232 / LMG 22953 / PM1) TaxID=420662 RepID=A2SPA3_METPP|nr:hypothetical protein [Methylibium petroleiphilum]ABM97392.1 hypothetical protein Mpe_B0628 [Methylibium petroleiphilum PM1]